MIKSKFRKIQKLVSLGLQELEKEMIENGVDITSDEAEKINQLTKEKLLGEFGLDMEKYNELKEQFKPKPDTSRLDKIDNELAEIKKKVNEPLEVEYED